MTTPEYGAAADRRRPMRIPVLVLLVAAVAEVGLRQLQYSAMQPAWTTHRLDDLHIYVNSVRAVLHGQYLYGLQPLFTYPPFALVAFAPLAALPFGVVAPVFDALKVLVLLVGAWLYLGSRGLSRRRALVWGVVAGLVAALFLDPVAQDIFDGQVDLVLLAVVLADLMRPRDARLRGVGVGLAAGVKLMPALFIVYLLVTRQVRAAVIATATFLGTVALGFALLPSTSWRYWTSVLWDDSRVWVRPDVVLNQTVRGIVVRAVGHDTPLWLPLAALVAAVGVATAAALHARQREVAALSAVGLTAAVVTPQGWIHHWVWIAPALLIIAVAGRRSVAAWIGVVVLFSVASGRFYYMFSSNPWEYDATHLSVGRQLLAAQMPIALTVLFVVTLVWLARHPAPTAAEGTPAARRAEVPAAVTVVASKEATG